MLQEALLLLVAAAVHSALCCTLHVGVCCILTESQAYFLDFLFCFLFVPFLLLSRRALDRLQRQQY